MSATDFHSALSACPGCDATALATNRAAGQAKAGDRDVALSLPTIHCAACISTVEKGLMAVPGVSAVRVNLTRKRAMVHAAPGVDDAELTGAS